MNTSTIQIPNNQVPTACGCQKRNGTGQCTNPIRYRFHSSTPVERVGYSCGSHYQMVLNEFQDTNLVHRYYLSNRNHQANEISFTEIVLNPIRVPQTTAPAPTPTSSATSTASTVSTVSTASAATSSSDSIFEENPNVRTQKYLRLYGVQLKPIPSHLSSSEIECTICQETGITNANGGCIGECNHCFHNNCIKQWFLKNKDTCPNCRSQVDVQSVIRTNQATRDHKRLRKLNRYHCDIVRMTNNLRQWVECELEEIGYELTPAFREYMESYMNSLNVHRDIFEEQRIQSNMVNETLLRLSEEHNSSLEPSSSTQTTTETP